MTQIALNFDTQKIVDKLGSHTFSLGYHYELNSYSGARARTGPRFPITPTIHRDGLSGGGWSNQQLCCRFHPHLPSCSDCALLNVPGLGDEPVALRQSRGEFGDPSFDTHGRYHAAYVNDSWTPNKHVTINAGYRWER